MMHLQIIALLSIWCCKGMDLAAECPECSDCENKKCHDYDLDTCPNKFTNLAPGETYRCGVYAGGCVTTGPSCQQPAQPTCKPFDLDTNSQCYPLDKCKSSKSMNYVFDPSAKDPLLKDFGGWSANKDHYLFYSKQKIEFSKLPAGYRFRCEHPDNFHFGLRTTKNRNWNEILWNHHTTWKYNIECQTNKIKHWSGGQGDFD